MTKIAWNNEECIGAIEVGCQDIPVESFPVLWKGSDKNGYDANIFAKKDRNEGRVVSEKVI
jgi:hypothetical protein